ncbi:MAG: hypothetical protein ACX939_08370 [Hyphococcus sp.]
MTDALTLKGYFVSRANTAHAALLVVGLMTLVQSILFCNVIIGGQPVYCRITAPAAKGAVYLFFLAFFVGYHFAISFFARQDAAYREKAGIGPDPGSDDTKLLMIVLNAATSISAMAVYSANMFLDPQTELCLS